MTESSRAPHFTFSPPTSPLERGEPQPVHHLYRIPSLIQLCCQYQIPTAPCSEIQITQIQLLFQKPFFPLPWCQRWKACTCQSQLQLGFDAFKSVTSCCDMRWEPRLSCSCLPAWFPIGNGNRCSIYCLVFCSLSSHSTNTLTTKNNSGKRGNITHFYFLRARIMNQY